MHVISHTRPALPQIRSIEQAWTGCNLTANIIAFQKLQHWQAYEGSQRSSVSRPIAEMAKGTGIEIIVKVAVDNMPAVLDKEARGTVTKLIFPYIHIAHVICRLRPR